ncbi:hypothetical protein [Actinocorallia aurea]
MRRARSTAVAAGLSAGLLAWPMAAWSSGGTEQDRPSGERKVEVEAVAEALGRAGDVHYYEVALSVPEGVAKDVRLSVSAEGADAEWTERPENCVEVPTGLSCSPGSVEGTIRLPRFGVRETGTPGRFTAAVAAANAAGSIVTAEPASGPVPALAPPPSPADGLADESASLSRGPNADDVPLTKAEDEARDISPEQDTSPKEGASAEHEALPEQEPRPASPGPVGARPPEEAKPTVPKGAKPPAGSTGVGAKDIDPVWPGSTATEDDAVADESDEAAKPDEADESDRSDAADELDKADEAADEVEADEEDVQVPERPEGRPAIEAPVRPVETRTVYVAPPEVALPRLVPQPAPPVLPQPEPPRAPVVAPPAAPPAGAYAPAPHAATGGSYTVPEAAPQVALPSLAPAPAPQAPAPIPAPRLVEHAAMSLDTADAWSEPKEKSAWLTVLAIAVVGEVLLLWCTVAIGAWRRRLSLRDGHPVRRPGRR